MEDTLEIRFTISRRPQPTVEEVRQALGDSADGVDFEDGVYTVWFQPAAGKDEGESLMFMFCEIGAQFPGAVLAE